MIIYISDDKITIQWMVVVISRKAGGLKVGGGPRYHRVAAKPNAALLPLAMSGLSPLIEF